MAEGNIGYIADLMRRMRSKEELPQSGPVKSSADTVSYQAHREGGRLCDTRVLPEIQSILEQTTDAEGLRDLGSILSGLIANTKDSQAVKLYLRLIELTPPDLLETMFLILGARHARIRECREYVLSHINTNEGIVLSEVIQYLGAMGDQEALHTIGKLLDADCNGVCHPMYCIFALEQIGDQSGVPYLERALERHNRPTNQEQEETRLYAKAALARLGHPRPSWDQNTQDMLSTAISFGNLEGTKVWIAAGADVNAPNNNGWPALCVAAWDRTLEIARFLLQSGANPNAVNNRGSTPLMIASRNGSLGVVQLLCDHGANVNATTPDGETALKEACFNGHAKVVGLLVERGADVHFRADSNVPAWSAITCAARGGNPEAIQILVKHGADVDETDCFGQTPLMVASRAGYLAAVQALAHAGADVRRTARAGETALDRASEKGHDAIVEFLRSQLERWCQSARPPDVRRSEMVISGVGPATCHCTIDKCELPTKSRT